LQLSPNASRVLIALGLRERIEAAAVKPQAIRVMTGGSGREIARIPLGDDAERRYGAPYWSIHRGDLQAALTDAANDTLDVTLELGVRVEEFAAHVRGVSVLGRRGSQVLDERCIALIGADGIWSTVAERLQSQQPPTFRHRTAWRALVPVESVPAEFRQPFIHLWLGHDAHLVHYPVKSGRLINIVGIVRDKWNEPGWSADGDRTEVLRHFVRWTWSEKARALIAIPDRWLKWALFDRKVPFRGGRVPVTLIGDAAHPMLPFLAQGAAMAIEDAAVLADMLAKYLDDPSDALRAYEGARWHRTMRTQQAARRQARIYGLTGPEAFVRNLAMRGMGGEKLRARYDWLYSWRPPQRFEIA
jgi:salicylate hydroxylase